MSGASFSKNGALMRVGHHLDRIGDAMYAVTAGGNQAAFVVPRAGVVLFDAPPSLATALFWPS